MLNLGEVNVHINNTEFLEALITCETFAQFSNGKMTTLEIHDVSVKAWLYCARSLLDIRFITVLRAPNLHMLSKKKKIRRNGSLQMQMFKRTGAHGGTTHVGTQAMLFQDRALRDLTKMAERIKVLFILIVGSLNLFTLQFRKK